LDFGDLRKSLNFDFDPFWILHHFEMLMESSGALDTMAMGVKCPSADQMVAKSLDNIVGNLWQQRQESSGSSVGNQVRFFYKN
jgi:hypothetical protein